MKVKLFQGHVLDCLKKIPDNSVDCIVTSPPYWGLRRYPDSANIQWPDGWFGQLGLEPTLDMYIEHLLQITKELKRVLKPTGVMFWNHGDSYVTHSTKTGEGEERSNSSIFKNKIYGRVQRRCISKKLPQKCMAMQNYRLILRMIDEQGWILRNIIIWYKPNHMPESVKDRFTKAYEPIFMLVKKKKYWFNLDAVREPFKQTSIERFERALRYGSMYAPGSKPDLARKQGLGYPRQPPKSFSFNYRVREAKKGHFEILGVKASKEEMEKYDRQGRKLTKHDIAVGRTGNFSYSDPLHTKPSHPLGKNPGDVWKIPTQPFPEAHFATFPEELVRRCIKCGCPENGWVLDPFVGSGTTLKVAIEERRNCIGIEIVPEYIKMTMRRCNLPNPFIEFKLIKC